MSQNTRESLSALMDGESEELELRRVLKALPDDGDAADTWRRYHLARSLMQRDHGVDTRVDMSAGIMARLSDEPAPLVEGARETAAARPARAPRVSLMRGAGVAAAVSLMVITGVQYLGGSAGGGAVTTPDATGELANAGNGGNQVDVDAALAQPASLAASGAPAAGSSNMPMFEPTPFRLSGETRRPGLMTVSDSGFASSPMGTSGVAQQAAPMEDDQVRLLQSYLQQHAHGAAYSNSDSWLPLTRSSAMSDALGR
ncbi:MAG: sigma-E factor negative regulatory protein [Halomonas sp.]|nr:sigma-E factor negative regulatory protein [Halomonas sp.]MDN6296765.1 sigma-E factor negative regulatory protein [Halomonas sp.]MDN6314039.1 sigma-E factor negative regulatory protein [Halomonas sp.]MDN6335417.1 sigma-E factor negative regulatory protein [Halomonas sp.]